MTHSIKKIIITIITIPAVFFGAQFAFFYIAYNWHHKKTDQFDNLKIQQVTDVIRISLLPVGNVSGTIIQQVNTKQESIIFSFTGSNDKLKSSYIFPLNGLIGYEMCYENGLNLYCFGKTK